MLIRHLSAHLVTTKLSVWPQFGFSVLFLHTYCTTPRHPDYASSHLLRGVGVGKQLRWPRFLDIPRWSTKSGHNHTRIFFYQERRHQSSQADDRRPRHPCYPICRNTPYPSGHPITPPHALAKERCHCSDGLVKKLHCFTHWGRDKMIVNLQAVSN